MLLPVIDRSKARGQTVVVRTDAAFALPDLYEALERRVGDIKAIIRPGAGPGGHRRRGGWLRENRA
jgi:hypothetical protein